MSQSTARREAHAKPEDGDVVKPRTRQAEHKQVVRPAGDGDKNPDGGIGPGEPDADEFELIGGVDDLGTADLGPIAPNTHDPDADSGRPLK